MEEYILPLHICFLVFAAVNVFIADHAGFAWMRGKTPFISEKLVKRTHVFVWVGLLGLIATGLTMFYPARNYLISEPVFWLKMFFVLCLFINAFVINRFMGVALTREYASLSKEEKLPLIISGAVSSISWLGALTCAFFLFPD